MQLDDIDKTGLIRESFNIEGIEAPECRSIFLDWAIKLSPEYDPQEAIALLLKTYGSDAEHPMVTVLNEGLGTASRTGRRGGRRVRTGR